MNINLFDQVSFELINVLNWSWQLNIPAHRDLLINEEKAFCERQFLYTKLR